MIKRRDDTMGFQSDKRGARAMAIQLFAGMVYRVQDLTHDVREIDLCLRDPAGSSSKPGG